MTVASNTVQTFAMVGIRENLSDVITLTDPMEVPFYSGIKKARPKPNPGMDGRQLECT